MFAVFGRPSTGNFEGKRDQMLDILAPAKGGFERILLAGTGNPAQISPRETELLGGSIAGTLLGLKAAEATIAVDVLGQSGLKSGEGAALIASGQRLRNYSFLKYKTRGSEKQKLSNINILTDDATAARKLEAGFAAIAWPTPNLPMALPVMLA